MGDDEHGLVDTKVGMRVAVDMDDIDIVPFGEPGQPAPACGKIGASTRHPFEPVSALGEDDIAKPLDVAPLSVG